VVDVAEEMGVSGWQELSRYRSTFTCAGIWMEEYQDGKIVTNRVSESQRPAPWIANTDKALLRNGL
jgi:hypothetical protein